MMIGNDKNVVAVRHLNGNKNPSSFFIACMQGATNCFFFCSYFIADAVEPATVPQINSFENMWREEERKDNKKVIAVHTSGGFPLAPIGTIPHL
jgi:hypothetical protein